jgi:hypothetical protein
VENSTSYSASQIIYIQHNLWVKLPSVPSPVRKVTLRGKIWNKLSTISSSAEESVSEKHSAHSLFQFHILICTSDVLYILWCRIYGAVWVRTPNSGTSLWMFWWVNLDLSSQPFGTWRLYVWMIKPLSPPLRLRSPMTRNIAMLHLNIFCTFRACYYYLLQSK